MCIRDRLQIIQQYVANSGLDIPEVQEDVIDHLCCLVEIKMEEGFDFSEAFQDAQQYLPENDIKDIQTDTIYFLTIKKSIIMIKTIFISGYLSVLFYILGVFLGRYGTGLGSGMMISFFLTLASVLTFCFVFLPALFMYGYKRFIGNVKA